MTDDEGPKLIKPPCYFRDLPGGLEAETDELGQRYAKLPTGQIVGHYDPIRGAWLIL